MKYLATLFVILTIVAPAVAQNHQVNPATLTHTRNLGASNQYTGFRYNGSGSLVAASQTKSGNATTTATVQASPYYVEYGYADSSAGANFQGVRWWKSVPVGSGLDSPKGMYLPDGTPVDMNGVPVDPVTGLPLPGEMCKIGMDLENPFEDRFGYFEVDEHDAATGQFLGTRQYAVGPGETIHINLGRERPFTATPYLMVDGTRNSMGGPVSSSGSGTGGGSASSPTTQVGSTGTVSPTPQPPAAGNTGTNLETKQAVDRVATMVGNLNDDVKLIGGETNRNLRDINASVNGVKDAVEDLELGGGGGDGLTPADLNGALQNGVDAGTDPGDGGLADGIAEGEDAAGEIPGIATSIGRIGAGLSGLIDSVGLGTSYGTSSLVWNISLPMFGSMTINLETYSWLWDLIRQITLWCFAFVMVGKFLKLFVQLPA